LFIFFHVLSKGGRPALKPDDKKPAKRGSKQQQINKINEKKPQAVVQKR
jgi:hypothetical protein